MANPKWYGISEPYLMNAEPKENWRQEWDKLMPFMKKWRFNTVRLNFVFPDAPHYPENKDVLDYGLMEQVLEYFRNHGIRCILDMMNWKGCLGWFGSPEWKNDWVQLAEHFKNDSRVFAWELFNEPGKPTWHTSVTEYADVIPALTEVVDAIRATGDIHPVVYPASWYFNGVFPEDCRRPNIIIGFHAWTQKNTQQEVQNALNWRIGLMDKWIARGFPVYIGETGIYVKDENDQPLDWELQKYHVLQMINAALDRNAGCILHRLEWNHGRKGAYEEVLQASNYLKPKGSAIPILSLALLFLLSR